MPLKRNAVLTLVMLLTGLLALASTASGQTVTGAIQGIVSDENGAAVMGAQVLVRNAGTGATRTDTTDEQGRYNFPSLEAGIYSLEVTQQGFAATKVNGIELTINKVGVVNVTLKISGVQEQVVVNSNVEVLDARNATLSGLVDSRRVLDLPLNGRNFTQLVNLQPGVAVVSAQGLLGGGSDPSSIQGSGQFVNGARGSVNSYLLDGGDANDPVVPSGSGASSTASFTGAAPGINAVSVEAVQEFRVITSSASAEFGRSSGAIINIITKSGTNDFHGSLFEFFRNRALNARNFFETSKPQFNQHNFGGSIGGPVLRNRLFFFGNYEGFRQRQAVSVTNVVPSPNTIEAVRRQNALLGALLANYFSGNAAANPGTFTDLSPEAIIAQGRPVVGTTVLPRGNGTDQNAFLAKLDQNFVNGGRISGRYQFFQGFGQPGTVAGTGIIGSNVGYKNRSQNLVLNYTQPLGAAHLNEARFTFQRNSPRTSFEATPDAVLDTGRLRTAGPFAGQAFGDPETPNGIPTISTVGFGIFPVGYSTTAPNRRAVNTFQISDTYTYVRSGHTFKWGGELRRIQENSVFSFRLRPEVTFASAGANTILAPGSPALSYDQNLFLLPATSERGYRMTEYGFFGQDNWQVTPRLTLDLGLRWEYFGRPHEVNSFLSNGFLAPGGNAQTETDILAGGPQGLRDLRLLTIGPGKPNDFYKADWNNFAPRVGLAYRPGWFGLDKTVVRMSYGIFYDRIYNNVFGNARNSPPFVLPVTLSGAPFGSLPSADPFTTTLPIGPVTVNPNIVAPYTQRWTLTAQRELTRDTVLEIGYVGSNGLKLMRTLRPNLGGFPVEFRPANVGVDLGTRTLDNFRPINYGVISTRDTSGHSSYHSLQASLQQRLSRGLSFQASYTLGHSIDIASGEIVNDIVVTTLSNNFPLRTADGRVAQPTLALVNQVRTSRGLPAFTGPNATAQAAQYYIDNFLGPNQFSADVGNSLFDIRHIFVTNFSYELPVGRGKHFGKDFGGVANTVLGGWQVNGILRLQTGPPLTLTTGSDVNGDGNAPDRVAVRAGDLRSIVGLNIASNGAVNYFAPSTVGTGIRTFANGTVIGNSLTPENVFSYTTRGVLHGPGIINMDFSAFKRFVLREQINLQFRTEIFNLFNHTNFGVPVTDSSSPLFGRITNTSTSPRQIQFGLRLEF